MKLYGIRGGTREDLEAKKYTIGVGISLGNKWFTVDNIVDLVKWSLEYSRGKVIVYVADSIHAINIEVRNRISHEKALKKTNAQGGKILKEVRLKIETEFSKEDAERVIYVKWDDIVDEKYKQKVGFLKSIYNKTGDFQNYIHSLVRSLTSTEKKVFTEEEIHRLGDYLIEELPEVINRVQIGGIVCDAYAYPYDGEITKFAENIQKGLEFPEIKENIMDAEPKVFLEVR